MILHQNVLAFFFEDIICEISLHKIDQDELFTLNNKKRIIPNPRSFSKNQSIINERKLSSDEDKLKKTILINNYKLQMKSDRILPTIFQDAAKHVSRI